MASLSVLLNIIENCKLQNEKWKFKRISLKNFADYNLNLNIAIKHRNRLACLRVAASAKAGQGHCKSLVAEPLECQALRSTNFAGVHFW